MADKVNWVKDKTEDIAERGTTKHNTDEENELLALAKKRFENAETEKVDFLGEPLHTKWRRYDEIYRNKQWHEFIPEDRSAPVLNFTFAIIQSLLPRLTDNQPEIIFKPRSSPMDSTLAEVMQRIVGEHLWYHNYMQERILPEAILHMLKYGTSVLKHYWDYDMWEGEGDVKFSVVHPMNFFPDPRAYDLEEADFCFVRVKKSLEYFLRRWPDKGPVVIPDQDWKNTENLQGRDAPSVESTASLTEYWFRDSVGDVCCMYYAGDIVLEVIGGEFDDNKPVYQHNKFPFSKMVDYVADKEFWGTGEIELIEMLQQLINTYEAQIVDNTRLMGNAQWEVNKIESGLDETDAWVFDNTPGRVIYTQNGGVTRNPGVPIPNHIPEHQDKLVFWFEQILGVYDVVQGRRPQGIRAASAIIALQEAASVRVREKAKNMGTAIRSMAEQAVSLVIEHYDEARTVRMSGEQVPMTINVREALEERAVGLAEEAGMLEATFEEPEGLPGIEMGGAPMGAEDPLAMGMGAEEGFMPPVEEPMLPDMREIGDRELPGQLVDDLVEQIRFPEFDIEVHVGPSIPYSQALLYEQAKEFYGLGLIDRQAVLEVTNFPGKEEILERMEQAESMALEAEMGPGPERMGERAF